MTRLTREQFETQVAEHKLTIVHNEGVHRHLTFRRADTINRYFNLTTWPGYLSISGDMGCYVFARLPDMFEFFREGKSINPGYWGEKLQAIARHEGYREFSLERYREAIVSDFREAYPFGTPGRLAAWQHMRDDLLLWNEPSTVSEAITAAENYRTEDGESLFTEYWDRTLEDYTTHFIWCCWAVKWGIEQYDAATPARAAA